MSNERFSRFDEVDGVLRKNSVGYLAQNLMYVIALLTFAQAYISVPVICMVGVTFCVVPGTRDKIFCHKGSFTLLLFMLTTVIVGLVHGNFIGVGIAASFAMAIVVAFVARALATKQFFEKLLNCVIVSGVLGTVCCVVEKMINRKVEGYRCQAFFTNPNFFGMAIALVILICAYKAVTHAKCVLFYYAAAIFCAIGIYLCGSMALWLMLLIGILLLLILNHEYKLLAIFMAVVACCSIAIVLVPGIISRLGELTATIDNRVKIWDFAIEQIQEAPWFGRGFYSYKFLYGQMHLVRPELYKASLSHNLVFESLISFGIVGTMLLGLFLISFLKTIMRCHDELKKRNHGYAVTTFIVAVCVCIACYGIIDTTIVWAPTMMVILFIMSGIGVDERELRHIYHAERAERLKQNNGN